MLKSTTSPPLPVTEPAHPWPVQGAWTYEDYQRLPEDGRKLGVVITAPFEVHLPNIAKPVQSDVLFIASPNHPPSGTQIFEGAPDLIVEVLSPRSVRLDQHVKFGAYERAGVREYWLADPKTRSVEIYKLPPGGLEYVLVGQFTTNETLRSELLVGLEIEVSELFAS